MKALSDKGMGRRVLGAGVPLAVIALAAGCSSGSGTSGSGGTSTASTAAAGKSTGTVITTKTGADGTFLTDGAGRTLYLWEKDPMGKSVCSGACSGAWPPVSAAGKVTASGGAKTADLGTITRSDGTKQVSYDGHALYYFVGDSGPGQTNGQGSDNFGAKWWLVTPAGTAITGMSGSTGSGSSGGASPSSSSYSGGGGGY